MTRSNCIVCGCADLSEVIDLGMHPFADAFIPESYRSQPDKIYPLVVDMCIDCKHIQTRTVTHAKDRYQDLDYSYTSSNSMYAMEHWKSYVPEVLNVIVPKKPIDVLEIGCNDGFLAEQFLKVGCTVQGVDASPYMADLSKQRGVPTEVGIFGQDVHINQDFDLIVANNVFNHSDNPNGFVRAVKEHLRKGGVFVFEVPYWATTVLDKKFDQIYHEHVSYFTIKSLSNLFQLHNMDIFHVESNSYHGGSIRVFACHHYVHPVDDSYFEFVRAEKKARLFDPGTYAMWTMDIYNARDAFLSEVLGLHREGKQIFCAGAAAKANTFLNFYRLDRTIVNYVTDASPHKVMKFTPGTRIPIDTDDILRYYKEPYVIITSWNLSDRLRQKLLEINPNIKFLNPYAKQYYVV